MIKMTAYAVQPEEIPQFVEAASKTKYAVPLLLALSSLRISEISALRWSDIPKDCSVVNVRGAEVLDENNKWVSKTQNKTTKSTRTVPILIPELRDAIENATATMPDCYYFLRNVFY